MEHGLGSTALGPCSSSAGITWELDGNAGILGPTAEHWIKSVF